MSAGPLERAPAWSDIYVRVACDAALTLWLLEPNDHIEAIERNLRENVIRPDSATRCRMVGYHAPAARRAA